MKSLAALHAVWAIALSASLAQAANPDPNAWDAVIAAAKGQVVHFNAWGGEPRINDYIAWVGTEVDKRYGVKLTQVKLADTADAIGRVVAEKAAGNVGDGSVDLVWINGKNFAAMKKSGLLFGPWAEALPNYRLLEADQNPAVRSDFTVPVEGLEAPWGKAQVVFMHDTAEIAAPPRSMPALLAWCKENPGRFTYPLPPDFLGSTFLKQALLELATSKTPLYEPVEGADFDAVTGPLWTFLDELHPVLWRKGKAFPANSAELRRLMADNETSIAFAFNPAEASAAIAAGELPNTVRTFVLAKGTIGNTHFVAIPFNAKAKAGALVVADFLMSAEAQARKQDPKVWGDFTVVSVGSLQPEQKKLFDALELGIATLSPAELGPAVPEPHPSWMERIEKAWAMRYTGT